jgi:alpha-beta hydrolase superfamily lysophospholipase
MIHGLAEHAGRYEHVGAALAAAGFTATLVELRGHGHSGGRRGHVARWSQYLDDIRAAAATLRPGWAMLAHSMGGLVSLDAVRDGVRPSRLALSAPLLGVAVKLPGWKVRAAGLFSRLVPALPMKNEVDPTALSRDAEIGKAYVVDPLVFDVATPRWYTEMLAAIARVHAVDRWDVPMTMHVGSADRITDPVAASAFAAKNRIPVTTHPDFRHELFNEIGKEQVIASVAAWLGEDASCASA